MLVMYLAIDIGGTKTLAAVFGGSGEIVEKTKFETPTDYQGFLGMLKSELEKFSTSDFTAGCVGARGIVNRASGSLIKDNTLNWHNVAIVADLESLVVCPFRLENDSKLAGLSEARQAGPDYRRILYVTISTGIGSAYIVGGEIDPNLADSEIGKWIFEHEGAVQKWEDFASGKIIVEKYGKRAAELEDATAWQEISNNIALGLINASYAYTPDLIVIGGGVGSHYQKFEHYLLKAIAAMAPEEIKIAPIRQAQNPEEAVIYGCYELIKHG